MLKYCTWKKLQHVCVCVCWCVLMCMCGCWRLCVCVCASNGCQVAAIKIVWRRSTVKQLTPQPSAALRSSLLSLLSFGAFFLDAIWMMAPCAWFAQNGHFNCCPSAGEPPSTPTPARDPHTHLTCPPTPTARWPRRPARSLCQWTLNEQIYALFAAFFCFVCLSTEKMPKKNKKKNWKFKWA